MENLKISEKSKLSEKDIEVYLRDEIKTIGGRAYKFVSPGNSGVPDRLVCLPGGRVAFVELKAPGKKPTVLQERQHKLLRDLGFYVQIIDGIPGVDNFVRLMQNAI